MNVQVMYYLRDIDGKMKSVEFMTVDDTEIIEMAKEKIIARMEQDEMLETEITDMKVTTVVII
jgi:hypothetical protein